MKSICIICGELTIIKHYVFGKFLCCPCFENWAKDSLNTESFARIHENCKKDTE